MASAAGLQATGWLWLGHDPRTQAGRARSNRDGLGHGEQRVDCLDHVDCLDRVDCLDHVDCLDRVDCLDHVDCLDRVD